MKGGKPKHRPEMQQESDFAIITHYQQVYRGIVQYYVLAHNIRILNKLHNVMRISLLKTLAGKHKTSLMKMLRKYRTTTTTAQGKTLRCLEVQIHREGKAPLVARFGGISLTRTTLAPLNDAPYVEKNGRTELIERLLADQCERCSSTKEVEVHHIRKLADLTSKGKQKMPDWKKQMIAMRRKTLVLCRDCHLKLHAGTL